MPLHVGSAVDSEVGVAASVVSGSSSPAASFDAAQLFRQWLAAGIANSLTSALLNPFDVAKSRLQTAPPASGATLRSTFAAMWARGGLAGLFLPGLSASMAREMLSSGARAGLYVPLRDGLRGARARSDATAAGGVLGDADIKIAAALGCGALGSLVANPVDVVKIRLQIDPRAHASARAALTAIARTEGARGLLAGLAPSTLRASFIAVGELATYDVAKTALRRGLGRGDEGAALHVGASLITGAVAAVVAAPFDLIKSRAMAGGAAGGASIAAVLRQLAREGGMPASLFRGVLPAYLRLGP